MSAGVAFVSAWSAAPHLADHAADGAPNHAADRAPNHAADGAPLRGGS